MYQVYFFIANTKNKTICEHFQDAHKEDEDIFSNTETFKEYVSYANPRMHWYFPIKLKKGYYVVAAITNPKGEVKLTSFRVREELPLDRFKSRIKK